MYNTEYSEISEIQTKRNEIIKGLSYLFSDNPIINVEKTGKEIRDKCEERIRDCEEKITVLDERNKTILTQVDCLPSNIRTEDGRKYSTFSWSQIDKYSENNTIISLNDKRDENIPALKEEYNDNQWLIQSMRSDCRVLETLKKNVEENKKYPLNIKQLSELGF